MRNGTQYVAGAIGLGILGVAYSIGAASAATSNGFAAGALPSTSSSSSASASASATSSTSASPSASASASASASPSASSSAVASPSATTKATSTPKASQSATSTPKSTATATSTPKATATATPTATASATVTKTSSVVPYRFGQVQLTVTKTGSKITAIDYSNSSASNGRQAAFPYLVQYAIAANGTNFGNLGGATYTTQAFQQALSNALSKF